MNQSGGNQFTSWGDTWRIYTQSKVIGMVFLGFSAGLPYLLVFSTLTAWLTEEGVGRSAIGLFAWVGITYSIKVIWAPIVDRMRIPLLNDKLGQRRSWILLGQVMVLIGLLVISVTGVADLLLLALLSLVIAFGSSTQDIAIDAYRIEAIEERFQGAMSASYILGYRVALLVAGAGALYIATYANWSISYLVMALLMGVGIATVFLVREPISERKKLLEDSDNQFQDQQFGFMNAVINPFREFFVRNGKFALLLLLFIGVYRLSDIAMGIMANPFYLDMGYSKLEIANVTKVFGFFMTILGASVGGLMVIRLGVYRCLLIGAVSVAVTNVFFAYLSLLPGPNISWLAVIVSLDNLSGGFAATAFVAFLSGLTSKAYTATQYALFSSLMTLPGKFISGFSGFVVDAYDYHTFFLVAAGLGMPAILLVWMYIKNQHYLVERYSDDQAKGSRSDISQ
jgi:PAT family beta-lactamase induction signal transducer AmpG